MMVMKEKIVKLKKIIVIQTHVYMDAVEVIQIIINAIVKKVGLGKIVM